jgi:MerR family copper efflux transcriptional regulator
VISVKRLGVPLESSKELLVAWDDEPCRSVKARLRTLLGQEREVARARIAELRVLDRAFGAALERLDDVPRDVSNAVRR